MNDIRKGHVLFHFSNFSKNFIKSIIFSLMNTAVSRHKITKQLCRWRMVGYHILIAFESFIAGFWKGSFNLAEGGTQSLFLVFKRIFQGEGKSYICYYVYAGGDGNTTSFKKGKKKGHGGWEEAIGTHCTNSFQLGPVLGSLARSVWTSTDNSPLKLADAYVFSLPSCLIVDVFIIVCTFIYLFFCNYFEKIYCMN